jgi:hypothetical protein
MSSVNGPCAYCQFVCDDSISIEKTVLRKKHPTKKKLLIKQFCCETCKNTWLKQSISHEIAEKLHNSKRELFRAVETMLASRKWLAHYDRLEYNLEKHARTKLICEWYCIYEKLAKLEIVFMTSLLREEKKTKLSECQQTIIGYWRELSKIHRDLNDNNGFNVCKTHIKYYSETQLNVVHLFGT